MNWANGRSDYKVNCIFQIVQSNLLSQMSKMFRKIIPFIFRASFYASVPIACQLTKIGFATASVHLIEAVSKSGTLYRSSNEARLLVGHTLELAEYWKILFVAVMQFPKWSEWGFLYVKNDGIGKIIQHSNCPNKFTRIWF